MKYRSTMSKKAFMRMLGLGGSTGASGIVASAFQDLDDVKVSPAAERKLPRWIREVDKPTAEIDWSTMKRFDCSDIMFRGSKFSAMIEGAFWPLPPGKFVDSGKLWKPFCNLEHSLVN